MHSCVESCSVMLRRHPFLLYHRRTPQHRGSCLPCGWQETGEVWGNAGISDSPACLYYDVGRTRSRARNPKCFRSMLTHFYYLYKEDNENFNLQMAALRRCQESQTTKRQQFIGSMSTRKPNVCSDTRTARPSPVNAK